MKFLRFLCNTLLFIVTTIVISLVQVGAYDLVACQDNFGLDKNKGTAVEVINVIPSEEHVDFIDSFTFWGTDIATGVKNEPKYRIRNWGNGWWSKNMKWADTALDATIAIFKPVFAPIAQVNAVKDYYLTENYDINNVYHRLDDTHNATDSELYEMYFVFTDFTYGKDTDINLIKTSDGSFLKDYNYSEDANRDMKINLEKADNEVEYIAWAKRHKKAYNIDWKLKKYNQPAYEKYFRKFIYQDIVVINGQQTEIRTIKSSVTTLYFIQFTSVILALIFVIKYPVSLLQLKYENGRKRRKALKENGD